MGKPIVEAIWPDRLAQYGKEVQRRKAELLNYIVFLRVTPILPNVFINVASPIVGVPILPFSLGKSCSWTCEQACMASIGMAVVSTAVALYCMLQNTVAQWLVILTLS